MAKKAQTPRVAIDEVLAEDSGPPPNSNERPACIVCRERADMSMRSALLIVLAVVATASTAFTSSTAQTRGGAAVDASPIAGDQAEPFIAVAPHAPNRIVATGMDFGSGMQPQATGRNIFVSTDGGTVWKALTSSIAYDLT